MRCALLIAAAMVATPALALDAREMAAVRSEFARVLVDPDSMRLSDLRSAPSPDGATIVCGEVNAKNRMGGYSGREPFIGMLMREGDRLIFRLVSELGDATSARFSVETCRSFGL